MNHRFFLACWCTALLASGSFAGELEILPDGRIRASDCPAWVEKTYRLEQLTREEAPDSLDDYSRIRACVERDSSRTQPVIPTGWCDNFLKVHCSALDLLDEIAAVQVTRCESLLSELLEQPEHQESWKRCGRNAVFDDYAIRGETSDGASCREVLLERCAPPAQASWPQWGGPRRDFQAPAERLASEWPEAGPPTLWNRQLGEGYSGILFEEGRLYTMYREGTEEIVVSLAAATGETLWEHRYEEAPHPKHLPQYGNGPRATPLLLGDRLFTVGVAGRLVALDKRDGSVLWERELWGEAIGGKMQGSGYSSSPLGHGDRVIVPVGGETTGLVALDQESGEVVWRSPGSRNSYSSPTLVELAGRAQLLSFMAEEIVALDPQSGELLWRYPHANQWGHNIHQPVVAGGDIVFLSSPQVGSRGLRVTSDGTSFEVEELWADRRIQLYHVTSVQEGDWVYASTGVSSPAFMVAVNVRTGETAWRERGFAKANCLEADGRLLIFDEDGLLYLATATPEQLEVRAQTRLFESVSWTSPTVVGTTLFARDNERIVAVDLG